MHGVRKIFIFWPTIISAIILFVILLLYQTSIPHQIKDKLTYSENLPQSYILANVPFSPQAPFGDWDDVRQDYGCEETALIIAMNRY